MSLLYRLQAPQYAQAFRTKNAPVHSIHRNRQAATSSFPRNKMTIRSSDSSSKEKKNTKFYPPSRFVIDEKDGTKWRLAVACAVLNSKNELLLGERIKQPGSWQAPQGGVDDAWSSEQQQQQEDGNNTAMIHHHHDHHPAETIQDAAVRELYEEMGLRLNEHVVLYSKDEKTMAVEPFRYPTRGNNWLAKSGYSGQQLHWCVFRCIAACDEKKKNDNDDTAQALIRACNIAGCGGEDPEFSNVQFKSIDWIVKNVWEGKRGPYEKLKEWMEMNKLV